jgi:hypothetical protein
MEDILKQLADQRAERAEQVEKMARLEAELNELRGRVPAQSEGRETEISNGIKFKRSEWTVGAVFAAICAQYVKKKNNRDGRVKISNGHQNKKRLNPECREVHMIGNEPFSVCLGCFKAGRPPKDCVFVSPRATFMHRHSKTCPIAVSKDPFTGAWERQTEENHVETIEWIYFWLPGVRTEVSFRVKEKFDVQKLTDGIIPHPGWEHQSLQGDWAVPADVKDICVYERIQHLLENYPKREAGQEDCKTAILELMDAERRGIQLSDEQSSDSGTDAQEEDDEFELQVAPTQAPLTAPSPAVEAHSSPPLPQVFPEAVAQQRPRKRAAAERSPEQAQDIRRSPRAAKPRKL